jgi:hypothetical protein
MRHAMPLVTLHDGRQVDSHSREWQIECLARHLLTQPLESRREFLAGMDKRRGERSTVDLRKVMTALHKQQRQAA